MDSFENLSGIVAGKWWVAIMSTLVHCEFIICISFAPVCDNFILRPQLQVFLEHPRQVDPVWFGGIHYEVD